MILKDQHKKKIIAIWDKYIADNKKVHDTKGNDLGDIDNDRREASVVLNEYINDYLNNKIDLGIHIPMVLTPLFRSFDPLCG